MRPSGKDRLKVRSLVGLVPLLAVEVLDEEVVRDLPHFASRLRWFLDNRRDLIRYIACLETREADGPLATIEESPSVTDTSLTSA